MGSATLVGSKPMGTQTEALVHESSSNLFPLLLLV